MAKSERRFLEHLIDAHGDADSSAGHTNLRRRKKRVAAALEVSGDDQLKKSVLEGMLFRHLSQQFSKLKSQEKDLDSEFPLQLVKKISDDCLLQNFDCEKDLQTSIKTCKMALPKIATNLLNSSSNQEFPKTTSSPFFLECWKGQKRINEDFVSVWQSDENSIYAVFDGHGGTSAADFASSILVPQIQKYSAELTENNIKSIFENVQKQLEKCVCDRSGTTAAVFIQKKDTCTLAWVGDSAIFGIDEQSETAELLSKPHSLECALMREEIVKRGAVVTGGGGAYRVNGELGVARALGRSGPRPAVSAAPSIFEFASSFVKQRFRWICLATDGVTDVLSLEKVAVCVRKKAGSPATALLEAALEAGAADNLSCIVVDVRQD